VARGQRKWYAREWWRIWLCRILSRPDAQSRDEPINNGSDTIPALRRDSYGTVFGRERAFRLVLVRSVHVAPTATGMVPYPEWFCHGRVDVVDWTGRGRRGRLDRGLVRKHVRAVWSVSLLVVVIEAAVSTVVSAFQVRACGSALESGNEQKIWRVDSVVVKVYFRQTLWRQSTLWRQEWSRPQQMRPLMSQQPSSSKRMMLGNDRHPCQNSMKSYRTSGRGLTRGSGWRGGFLTRQRKRPLRHVGQVHTLRRVAEQLQA
jgi:hypothetical protein